MTTIDSLKKTLSSLKGHRSRHQTRFDKNLQYSDMRRTEQLKIALLEQNDKIIAHLEKMGEAGEDESLQAAVSKELAEAMAIDEAVNEEFVVYRQRIQENLAQANQTNGADHDGEADSNLEETATNVRTRNHLKNVHKKPTEMESDISLKDFETWKRKFKDYLVLTGLNDAPKETQVATLRGFLSSDMYDKLRISVGVEDDTDLGVEQILELLRKFIRSKRNIALDRVLFEQRKQLKGEDFETFLVAIKQIAENANLCEGHCPACTKICTGLRIATKIVS